VSVSVPTSRKSAKEYRLRVSRYDRVSGMLVAWVVLLGVVVGILLIIWWTSQIKLGQAAVEVELMQLGDGDGPMGGDQKLAGAIDEEIELLEASAEVTLAAIADAISTKVAVLDDPSLSDRTGKGRGGGGRGMGLGSGTGSGTGSAFEIIMPKGLSLDGYARILDGLEIELAVLLPGNKVQYVKNMASSSPTTRIGPADKETRYYLTWRRGDLLEADRGLLRRAGIEPENRLILKFLTPQRESNMVAIAMKHAKDEHGLELPKILKTYYSVRKATAGGWEFSVMRQSLR